MNPGRLKRTLAKMREALDLRDLPTLLEQLHLLVPGYAPSATLLSLAAQTSSRVAS